MTTVIFVHGTGGRESNFSETFAKIKLTLLMERPDINVIPCLWGDSLGAKLNASGTSIPEYDTARGFEPTSEDYKIVLWQQLYQDPLYELRLLSLKSSDLSDSIPGQANLWDILDTKVRNFRISGEILLKLNKAGIAEVFEEAKKEVQESIPYTEALQNITDETLKDYYAALARAIIAEAIALAKTQNKYAVVLTNATLRDELIDRINEELTDRITPRGVIDDWVKKQLFGLAVALGTSYIKRKRGSLTDLAYPITGDILLYQGRQGSQVRVFINDLIQQAESPVVLLAHSLGGIACVDMLAEKAIPKVSLLITVGSQAPFLYEINALHSLQYPDALPKYFPKWLNVYDRRDFLSYIGEKVFPGRVQDIPVNNKQPFPESHGAYWENVETWNAILPQLP